MNQFIPNQIRIKFFKNHFGNRKSGHNAISLGNHFGFAFYF